MNSFGVEKATPIRLPSTANLMIDSADRTAVYPSPFDFQITKPNALMNGFFSRIGTTEVVLQWCEPNIIYDYNDTIFFDVSGTGANTFDGLIQGLLAPGVFYTAAQALQEVVDTLNIDSGIQGAGVDFLINTTEGGVRIDLSGAAVFRVREVDQTGQLANELGIIKEAYTTPAQNYVSVGCVDLRPYKYLDFTSAELTYNQDLKDTTTANYARDVLCRWYFAWDTPPELDPLGFPILMGYTPFVTRRLFNPPKQIKWDNSQPVGNLRFQVFGALTDGTITSEPITGTESDWLMTLQVSEN